MILQIQGKWKWQFHEYFMEYFEEAGPENEAQVIAELGTPKEAAHEVISRLLDEKIIEEKSSLRNKTTILTGGLHIAK